MTVTLTPQLGMRLREKAEREGQDVNSPLMSTWPM